MSGASVAIGQWFATGISPPPNSTGKAIEFEEIEPASTVRPGVEIRSSAFPWARKGDPEDRNWPPHGCSHRLEPVGNFEYKPNSRMYFVVGLRSRHVGKWFLRAFRIRYRIGAHHYETLLHEGIGFRVTRCSRAAVLTGCGHFSLRGKPCGYGRVA